jgi:hypothetical protein
MAAFEYTVFKYVSKSPYPLSVMVDCSAETGRGRMKVFCIESGDIPSVNEDMCV